MRIKTIGWLAAAVPWLAMAAPTTFGPSAKLGWDYPVEEQARIEGFALFVNGTQTATVLPDKRQAALKALKLANGPVTVKVRAFAGSDVSEFSNEVAFTYSETPLTAPSGAKIILTFPVP